MLNEALDRYCDTGSYTSKVDLIDHLVQDLTKVSNLEILDASPFEKLDVHIKRAYRTTSQPQGSGTLGLIEVMEATRRQG